VLNQVRKFDLDQIVTLGLTIAGVAIMIGGIRLKIGTVSVPEPGFFPFISGAVVAALSMCRLIASGSRKSGGDEVGGSIDGSWKAVALAAALIVYTLILDWLGFTVATSLLAIAVMRIAHRQSWVSIIAISITLAVICQYLFSVLLRVSLPAGTFF
jgi:putative tricarboxylic transport membrane protein